MPRKTPAEKLRTKIDNLLLDDDVYTESNGHVMAFDRTLFTHDDLSINYTATRFYPSRKEEFITTDLEVTFMLSDETLRLLSSNISKPPKGVITVAIHYNKLTNDDISKVVIGAGSNNYENGVLSVTTQLYKAIVQIDKDEQRDKGIRVRNRVIPFFNNAFGIEVEQEIGNRDYALLLEEIVQSGQYSQDDIIRFTSELKEGDAAQVVIAKQVYKQVEWLIEAITKIVDEDNLTKPRAQELGSELFGFTKVSIKGPEHLMEMILTKYGRNTLFGVPVLLNTDKYVVHAGGLPRSQFDLVIVNHLCDVEVVELKRPDSTILDYDKSRGKFFPNKELSVALAQAERYISSVYKDNDEDYLIDGQKIRDFLNAHTTDDITVEICRPKAVIIMGSFKTLKKPYAELSASIKAKVTEAEYNNNAMQAYKEIKASFRNIDVLTYSELLETARARLKTSD